MAETTFKVDKENLKVVMERTFDAPREKVFKAYTDPEQIPKWWGQASSVTVVDKMDVRVGGLWRFVQKSQDGSEHAFNGEYKEVTPVERLTYTFEYEPMAGHVLTETIELQEVDGKTKVISSSAYANIDDLEGMVASGMESGARESYEQLAELLENT